MAQISAAYFTLDSVTNASPARQDIQTIMKLVRKWSLAADDIERGTTDSGEPLTAQQKTNIRNGYTAYLAAVDSWRAALPTP